MNTLIESFEHAGFTVEIHVDEDPLHPRKDWDNASTMACWHRRMNLGDEQIKPMSEEEMRELHGDELLAILPLYMYDHSGIALSCSPFSCPWDSGQVGWVYITKSQAKEMGFDSDKTIEFYENVIRSEVKVYSDYVSGNCFMYVIKNQEGQIVDSCGGYFGSDEVGNDAKHAAEEAAK